MVLEEINALPSKDNLTLDDEVALAGAEAHYNALSDAQKEYLTGKAAESVAKLGELRTQLEKLKKDAADKAAADAVTEKLNALPSEEDVMFQDEAVLKQAREAYEQLDDTQKALVSNEAYDKLEKAEKKLEALKAEVEAVTKQIQELPAVGDLTLEDEEKVALARSAYDALNADQKRQLTESGVLDTLLTAENQISLLEREKEEAEKVAQQINSLPEVKDLKLADKTAVEAARKAYDALSDNQKAMIEDAKKALEEEKQKSNAYKNWQIIPINQTQTTKMMIRKTTTRITTKTITHQRPIRITTRVLVQQPVQQTKAQIPQTVQQPTKERKVEARIRQQELRHRQAAAVQRVRRQGMKPISFFQWQD